MARFNQSITTGEALTLDASVLPVVNVWSASPKKVVQRYPQYQVIVDTLRAMLSTKRFETLSISHQNFTRGAASCSDTGWHVDGRMNPDNPDEYALICFGADGMRTMFHDRAITTDIPNSVINSPQSRATTFKTILEHDLHDESVGFEVPHATPVAYTCFDFHKGRRITSAGQRLLIRLSVSDFIKPRPVKIR
ncbi:MAG: hypothetical protein CMF12_08605 [Idiomarina sp.]|uniref:hypothetical protein n=1 Tax=Idiomarina sp. TaxID=1874361 RepID=UPI000C358531|nr:hypothetical protein [Idiomarina sp.]MBT42570.1 hypothetical protein [Idiomarina sp.]